MTKQAPADKKTPNRSIFVTILRSMLAVLLVELVLLIGILYFSRVNVQLEQNAADLLQKQVENRQSYLQSLMLSAQDLSTLAGSINTTAQSLIDSGDISVDTLDRSNEDALPLLSAIGEKMIASMRRRSVTGIFVVLNTHDLDTRTEGDPLPCLYLRDLEPSSSPSVRNSDLLIERAPSQIVQSLHISTDTCWMPSLLYSETRADGLLYPVFQAAYHSGGELETDDLGHWTVKPYTLSGDTHSAIAYTVPLMLDDGTVYGVLGVEMLESHLRSLLPSSELQNDGSGSYLFALADRTLGGSDFPVSIITDSAGENAALEEAGDTLLLTPSIHGGYRAMIDGEYCHASVLPLSLYSRNAPFYNEVPLLIGIVPESQLYAFSGHVTRLLIIAVLLVLAAGLFSSLLVAQRLAKPVARLSSEVTRAQHDHSSIPTLSPTGINELDRFSSAFTRLSRDVLAASTKFLRIMDMASVELGGYELRFDPESVYATDNFFPLLGLQGVDISALSPEDFRGLLHRFEATCPPTASPDGSKLYCVAQPDGSQRYIRIETTYEDDAQVGLAEDVTSSTLERLRIEHERDYDTLTGLYNRRAFQRICSDLFCEPEKLGHAALLMFDLDGLKHTNDTFGHDWGDEYIRQTGLCFAKNAPARTICSRISGDEFNIFLYGYHDQDALRADIHALHEALKQTTVELPSGRALHVSVSGGVAWYPESCTNLVTLRKYTDFAMYQVKHSQKGRLLEFDPEVYRQDRFASRSRAEFHRLVNEELITYYFQPLISAATGEVLAYEALMRVEGLSTLRSPDDVLRLAKEENCLHEIERITFFHSSRSFLALEESGRIPQERLLFVNSIASQHLTDEEQQEYFRRFSHLLPHLVIEITEEEGLDLNALKAKRNIAGSAGAFALDDYGSGYSNERSLLELSPDYIKIDLSIIRHIDTDANKRQIVSNTVAYAHPRGMKVVAEGLETPEELRTVLSLGVDLLQGFYLARPAAVPGPVSSGALETIRAFHSSQEDRQISIFPAERET